jgi:FkbM family methyltransferase
MIVAGIHLPDSDTHFGPILEGSERVDGKATYQLAKLRRAVALVQHRGHAVDVGAQVGLWTRVLARDFQFVTAFEPVPDFFDCLVKNCYSMGVTFHRCALGNDPGQITLACPAGIATAALSNEGANLVHAAMMMLDDCGLLPLDLLKIDAEGFETAIVAGGEQTIRRDKPVVILEQKRKRMGRYGFKPEAGVDLLRSWGAEVAWEEHGDWCLQWPA